MISGQELPFQINIFELLLLLFGQGPSEILLLKDIVQTCYKYWPDTEESLIVSWLMP